jgi:hypothetical protein
MLSKKAQNFLAVVCELQAVQSGTKQLSPFDTEESLRASAAALARTLGRAERESVYRFLEVEAQRRGVSLPARGGK